VAVVVVAVVVVAVVVVAVVVVPAEVEVGSNPFLRLDPSLWHTL